MQVCGDGGETTNGVEAAFSASPTPGGPIQMMEDGAQVHLNKVGC